MFTEKDEKNPLSNSPTKEKSRNLAIFHALLSVLAAVMLIAAVTILFTLCYEILPNSSDFEKATGILNIAVPVIITNAILIIAMAISLQFASEVSGKSALALIQGKTDLLKFTAAYVSLEVNKEAFAGTEGAEELVEQLQLFSLNLNETVKFAMKIKEKTDLFTEKINLGTKKQKEDFLSSPRSSFYSDELAEVTSNQTSEVVNPLRDIFSKQTLEEFLETDERHLDRYDVQEAIETATLEKQMGGKCSDNEIMEDEGIVEEPGEQTLDAESCAGVPSAERTLPDDSNGAPEINQNSAYALEASRKQSVGPAETTEVSSLEIIAD